MEKTMENEREPGSIQPSQQLSFAGSSSGATRTRLGNCGKCYCAPCQRS